MSTLTLGSDRIDVAALIAAASIRFAQLRLDAAAGPTQSVRVDTADQADVRASLGGDSEAYARLVRRYQQALAQRMRRFARDRSTLEELVQEVFVQAYFSLRSYKATAPFEHWLNRIATRVGYRHWEKQRGKPAQVGLEGHDSPAVAEAGADAVEAHEAGQELRRLMNRLPPRDRLVLTLLYLEERSVVEAAEMAGWSQTMVKVQAFRARAKLRRLLEAQRTGHEEMQP